MSEANKEVRLQKVREIIKRMKNSSEAKETLDPGYEADSDDFGKFKIALQRKGSNTSTSSKIGNGNTTNPLTRKQPLPRSLDDNPAQKRQKKGIPR